MPPRAPRARGGCRYHQGHAAEGRLRLARRNQRGVRGVRLSRPSFQRARQHCAFRRMQSSSPLSITRGERALQSALALLWFGVTPALLAALLLRFAWPSPLTTELEWLRALTAAPFVAGALLFALLAALLGYWRRYLPGGRFLGALPPSLAQHLATEDIAAFAAANTLRLSIATEAKRARSPLSTLSADERARLASYQQELD